MSGANATTSTFVGAVTPEAIDTIITNRLIGVILVTGAGAAAFGIFAISRGGIGTGCVCSYRAVVSGFIAGVVAFDTT